MVDKFAIEFVAGYSTAKIQIIKKDGTKTELTTTVAGSTYQADVPDSLSSNNPPVEKALVISSFNTYRYLVRPEILSVTEIELLNNLLGITQGLENPAFLIPDDIVRIKSNRKDSTESFYAIIYGDDSPNEGPDKIYKKQNNSNDADFVAFSAIDVNCAIAMAAEYAGGDHILQLKSVPEIFPLTKRRVKVFKYTTSGTQSPTTDTEVQEFYVNTSQSTMR